MAPDLAWQPSLLDGGEPRIDVSYDGLRRIELDARSWVDYCPGWLAGSDSVFEVLAREARWQQRTVTMWDKQVLEPRLTAGWSTDATQVPPLLAEMCRLLSARYDVGFDSVWVNLYRDGQDSVAWHGDRNRLVMDQPMVATVSLGARRRFLLRRRGSSRIAHELAPGAGDLVVMGGACQQEWEHTVPKSARVVGPRMAVTIRHSRPHTVTE
ncbi:MAG TPA: alpha-ketoglutarate-dependent dioxygenase AlkB [Mycobacteriales bacterium]|nr:alpha-ketoglutarate-dependent dioxygenase AlkB [Mycobacteriales bacterium]